VVAGLQVKESFHIKYKEQQNLMIKIENSFIDLLKNVKFSYFSSLEVSRARV